MILAPLILANLVIALIPPHAVQLVLVLGRLVMVKYMAVYSVQRQLLSLVALLAHVHIVVVSVAHLEVVLH